LDKLHQQALSDDTTLLQLLSYSSKDAPQMGLLWVVIKDLVSYVHATVGNTIN